MISFKVETTELETVRRMGSGVPVMLIIADLVTRSVYFVCLNDYVDKILLRGASYRRKKTQTIYVPTTNQLKGSPTGPVPLRAYAKRPKLYAAFQEITYQRAELNYVAESDRWAAQLTLLSEILLRHDFWTDCDWWALVKHYRLALRNVSLGRRPGLMRYVRRIRDEELKVTLRRQEERALWDGMAALARTYEEIVREWWLPGVPA